MSVNLSPKQFGHPDLVREVAEALRDSSLPAGSLVLEITEGAFIENSDRAVAMMHQLREMGVHVCIDDFGTGYSSLSYLHRFPVSSLKIDRSFVSRVDREGKQVELVQGIIKMAADLGIGVVAEGVETPAQIRSLKDLDCGFGQGYTFSRPAAPDAILGLLRRSELD